MATLAPYFAPQFLDQTGTAPKIAAGYSLYTYSSGTTTPKATYTDPAGTILNPQPIVLDSAGKCTLFLGSGAYTFVLKTPLGVVVDSWDDVLGVPAPSATNFLPLAGGIMSGLFTLSGNATAALHPVPKQQMDAAIAAANAALQGSIDTGVAAANAAAAAAVAAAGAVKPTRFELPNATCSAATRDVYLTAGTWQVVLRTNIMKQDAGTATYDFTVTQAGSISTTTVNTSIHIGRAGGSGYGRYTYASGMAVGTLTVTTAGTFTMAMAAASLDTSTGIGSILSVEKV